MSICLWYTHTREEAVKVLNDGFFKLQLDQYDPERPFKGWLRQILSNTALNHYHKAVQHYYQEDVDQIANHVPSGAADAHSQLAYNDSIKLISQLTPAYRLVFNLNVIDGFSHEEIAAQLGISVGTSKFNLARAREKLKDLLQKKRPMSVHEWPDDDLDDLFRKSAEESDPATDPQDWQHLKARLDRHDLTHWTADSFGGYSR